ncbi:serine hydrolase [Marixanthomonas sp. SCSIO 43207]|uniref:serine hydrolase domain-containing protein n=1 Tax=Marixanthomonas sp. SCSIO 43207 TaxID=2779360 RepID=UPI001CA9FCA4|nr:serine hydrolase [Marixanthomonas sp. SCSIO 43207]UAB82259.1 serine hydrolase [Marixanthomonas sp. SCSIO 43207]
MEIKSITILFIVLFSFSIYAQDMAEYTSGWEGKIENSKTFNLKVEIENLRLKTARFKISNNKRIIDFAFDSKSTSILEIPFAENYSFKGQLSENDKEINGFIKSGMLLYHLKLKRLTNNTYTGIWNLLMVDELKSDNFYLSVENGEGNDFQAYPIFGDNRFTGTWCDNFQKENDLISFTDFKTGLQFKGKLMTDKIQLGIYLGKYEITQVVLNKSTTDWQIGKFKSDNNTSIIELSEMEKLILNDSLPNTHSVLISKKGEVVYENYFDGYNANIPHDMKSASKSISSAIVGIAKDKSLFPSIKQSIFDFLPKKYQTHKDSLKTKIDIQSLLTMSSGLDADDYTRERNSSASENNYQPTKDWAETVLKAPMINNPNTEANYGSANPYLLGIAIDSIVSEPLALFMDKYLFQELEISNYIIQTDLKGIPYFGGGMYLTPRDMLKFGELYLNKGKWKSERVLSKKWVKDSFKNYHNLENVPDKNGYGYLWWHNTYQVNGKNIKTVEARGAGGQYIFVIPCLKTVVVITSGNYRNGKTQQPELIFEKYILPYLKN